MLATAEGNSVEVNPDPVPDWLQNAEAVGQALGTLAVIIALAAFIWQWRQARKDRDARDAQAIEDRNRHEAQIAALRQAEDERLAAQARWVVLQVIRGTVFNPQIWNLRIDNQSMSPVSNLHVDVIIMDANGNEVPHGYRLANIESIGDTMSAIILPEFSRALDGLQGRYAELVSSFRDGAASLGRTPEESAAIVEEFNRNIPPLEVSPEIAASLRSQVNQAVYMQFSTNWAQFLYANQFTALAIETTRADYIPHLRIRYQDAAGYTWERTDTTTPRRLTEQELQD